MDSNDWDELHALDDEIEKLYKRDKEILEEWRNTSDNTNKKELEQESMNLNNKIKELWEVRYMRIRPLFYR